MRLEILVPDYLSKSAIPFALEAIQAGFPSPAEDYIEERLNISEYIIKNPSSTFYARVVGSSMVNAGISAGDLLVVDRSLRPGNNQIVVAVINSEFTVKRLSNVDGKVFLIPENDSYKPIEITETMDFKIWGVVSYVIKKM